MITSYQCYECGEEYSGEPAAEEQIDGDWRHLCAGCFDEWFEKHVEGAA